MNGLTGGDSRYMAVWCGRYGRCDDEGPGEPDSYKRARRAHALRGPLPGMGPTVRLALAILGGDRAGAATAALAINDAAGWVGGSLPAEQRGGGR